jgi:hypothetical protein
MHHHTFQIEWSPRCLAVLRSAAKQLLLQLFRQWLDLVIIDMFHMAECKPWFGQHGCVRWNTPFKVDGSDKTDSKLSTIAMVNGISVIPHVVNYPVGDFAQPFLDRIAAITCPCGMRQFRN